MSTARSASCSSERGSDRARRPAARARTISGTVLPSARTGVDVPARLPLLSTYLGHTQPRDTYWYVQAAPELLELACGRLERSLGGQP